jgi:hypothetical protein
MNHSFDQKIQEKAQGYRPEPNLQFADIMQRTQRNPRVRLYRLLGSVAAGLAMILMAVLFIPNQEEQVSLYAQVELIGDLEASPSGLYDAVVLHDLYRSVN